MTLPKMIASLTIAAMAAQPSLALAQGSIFDIPEAEQKTFIDVGAAYLSRPAYLGSNAQKDSVLPYLAGEYKGRLFFDASRGAGVHAIHTPKLQVSAYGWLASGREADETGVFNDLRSINAFATPAAETAAADALELKSSFLASSSVRYLFKYGLVDLSASVPVTGDVDGYRSELTVTSKIPFEPIGLKIFPGVRATYTSSDWNNSYYGIDAEQSLATGLDQFDVGSGVSSLGSYVLTSWSVPKSDIQLVGVLNYNWLQGDIKDSLLTPDDSGFSLVLGAAKRF